MRGLAATEKTTRESTPDISGRTPNISERTPERTPRRCADDSLFFRHVSKVADVGRKDWVYALRVSKTLVDGYFNGTKRDPFTLARKAVDEICAKRPGLRPAILTYIAGGEAEFDDALFNRLQEVFSRRGE